MHVRRALALALAGPLLLAGCTGDPEPTPNIPDPTSSSPTSSPTDSETAEAESAEDFIRRWSDELQKMQATGDTAAFRKLGPDCDSCIQTAEQVQRIYEAGGSIEWDGWTIVSIEPLGASHNEFRIVERSAPTKFRESPTDKWQRLNGGRTTHIFELASAGNSWVVVRAAEAAS